MSARLDPSVIPPGGYCYVPKRGAPPPSAANGFRLQIEPCPYWSRRADKPEQENGHCAFLGHGDWEVEHIGLLWDQVKECGVNDEEPVE